MSTYELLTEALKAPGLCQDDCVSPEPNEFLCTLQDNHETDHVAVGDGKLLARWPRSKGRPASFLRAKYGIKR